MFNMRHKLVVKCLLERQLTARSRWRVEPKRLNLARSLLRARLSINLYNFKQLGTRLLHK